MICVSFNPMKIILKKTFLKSAIEITPIYFLPQIS